AYDGVVGETKQQLLSNFDIEQEQNAIGKQEDSFEAELSITILDKNNNSFRGVFIRAPIVTEVGVAVDIIAKFNDRIVGVRQGNVIGTSFHPELSGDERIHRQFIKAVLDYKNKIGAQQNQAT